MYLQLDNWLRETYKYDYEIDHLYGPVVHLLYVGGIYVAPKLILLNFSEAVRPAVIKLHKNYRHKLVFPQQTALF